MVNHLTLIFTIIFITGCTTAAKHRDSVANSETDKLTVGVVQKEIREGMSGADVASVLGSPNIVTSDKNNNETWIYDKISTEYVFSNSSGGVGSLIIGIGSAVGAGVGGSYGSSSGASSTSQKTLTIIIKFVEGKVSEYSYRSSSF